jgi:hypothetical protein
MNIKKMDMITIPLYTDTYPSLDDSAFNSKITSYSDFNIKGKLYHPTTQEEVEELSDRLCNSDIELSTYQTVVRNFLSNDTPYNGLLLFHGLGTGKTCSAITIAEEHRKFLKQSGLGTLSGNKVREKRIYVLGGPNIKSNFKKQLFDASHLQQNGNEWTCKSCVGNAFLREVNPSGLNIQKEELVTRIEDLIKRHYKFMGYIEFANFMFKSLKLNAKRLKIPLQRVVEKEFEHCMFVIDEVHNVKNDDSKEESPSHALDLVVKYTTVKLLLLSATPMFNEPSEIVWITNLLNRNDKRPAIVESDFFKDGELLEDQRNNFIHHTRGYISFVKGENPYTFPYRVYPLHFDKRNIPLPTLGMDDTTFEPLKTQLYPVVLHEQQRVQYFEKLKELKQNGQNPVSIMNDSPLLGMLNMSYPDGSYDVEKYMKKSGKYKYEYFTGKEKCFDTHQLEKYSAKIHSICKHIEESEGIVMIYSRFISKGVIPMALALESMGFKNIHGNLMKTQSKSSEFNYCLLTGDKELSPTSEMDIKKINNSNNTDGSKIKVVIISEAASEGVDFKNIRQIHIMEPWWHLNRLEQIIGRGIRLCSHKKLPFTKRNAQIFLHVAISGDIELIDHYFYRYSEEKAKKIGNITRLIKENAMDCEMNHAQFQPSEQLNLIVKQELSDQSVINYPIGDSSFSVMCDFMSCDYKCSYPSRDIIVENQLFDINRTIERIRNEFRHGYAYTSKELFTNLNLSIPISERQMFEALTQMVDLKTECRDMLHRPGYIVNYGKYYLFQPEQLKGDIPVYERRIPMYSTTHSVIIKPSVSSQKVNLSDIIQTMKKNYEIATTPPEKTFEKEWYSLVPRSKKHIWASLQKFGIVQDDYIFNHCILDHMIEMLVYKECAELLHYLFFKDCDDFEQKIKNYFKIDKNKVRIWNDDKVVTLRLDEDAWIVTKDKSDIVLLSNFGRVVGGITNKNADERTFKSKSMLDEDTDSSGISYGQICENAKLKSEPRIKSVLGDTTYGNLSRKQICCELELLLRYLDKIKHNKVRWFLSAIEVIDNNKKITDKRDNSKMVNLIKK